MKHLGRIFGDKKNLGFGDETLGHANIWALHLGITDGDEI
jgi:hypothetical protein